MKKISTLKNGRSSNENGFTLVEILMVVILIAILAAVGVTQFLDFSRESKNAATKANLKILRNAISSQYARMRVSCDVIDTSWPPASAFNNNDLTNGTTYNGQAGSTPCLTSQITSVSDRIFVSGGIPVNPWSNSTAALTLKNMIWATTVTTRATGCNGSGPLGQTAAVAASAVGWCYNTNTGEIWANSAANMATAASEAEWNY
jgi:prepilin-type N-terminal cleavage/methylation domain-containing protein